MTKWGRACNSGVRRGLPRSAVVWGQCLRKQDCSAACNAVSLSIVPGCRRNGTAALRCPRPRARGDFNSSRPSIEETEAKDFRRLPPLHRGGERLPSWPKLRKLREWIVRVLCRQRRVAGGGKSAQEACFSAVLSAQTASEAFLQAAPLLFSFCRLAGSAAARAPVGSGGGGSTKLGSGSSDKLLTSYRGGCGGLRGRRKRKRCASRVCAANRSRANGAGLGLRARRHP